MPVVDFDIAPQGDGDVGFIQQKDGVAISTSATNVAVGGQGSKPNIYRAAMWRFDLAGIPADVTINGVRINWKSGGWAGASMTFAVGFCDKDGSWDASGGFSNYSTAAGLPMAEWADGASQDVTVWVGNAPAFSISHTTQGNSGTELSFGENLAATVSVTGLVSQLQAYIDAEGAAPPCMIQSLRVHTAADAIHQGFLTSDSTTEANRPTLTVDYTVNNLPPVVTITSPTPDPYLTHQDEAIIFTATAEDVDDGDISADLVWTSDVDGAVGTGRTFATAALSVDTHVITATVTDAGGLQDTDTVGVTISTIARVSGRIELRPMIAARSEMKPAVSGQGKLNPVVSGRGVIR